MRANGLRNKNIGKQRCKPAVRKAQALRARHAVRDDIKLTAAFFERSAKRVCAVNKKAALRQKFKIAVVDFARVDPLPDTEFFKQTAVSLVFDILFCHFTALKRVPQRGIDHTVAVHQLIRRRDPERQQHLPQRRTLRLLKIKQRVVRIKEERGILHRQSAPFVLCFDYFIEKRAACQV